MDNRHYIGCGCITKEEAKKYAKKERENGYLARVVMDWYGWTVLGGPRKR